MAPANVTESDIQEWCIAYLTRTVDNPAIAIGPESRLTELAPELVFEYPTIGELARHIATSPDGAADARGG